MSKSYKRGEGKEAKLKGRRRRCRVRVRMGQWGCGGGRGRGGEGEKCIEEGERRSIGRSCDRRLTAFRDLQLKVEWFTDEAKQRRSDSWPVEWSAWRSVCRSSGPSVVLTDSLVRRRSLQVRGTDQNTFDIEPTTVRFIVWYMLVDFADAGQMGWISSSHGV